MKWTATRQEEVLERGLSKHLHRVRVAHLVREIEREVAHAGPFLRLLDVGCGDGVITKRLRAHFAHASITGLDADDVRLARARIQCPGAAFEPGDVTALPYHDASFDVVLCHHVVEHVENDEAVLRECRRVLRPGGLLLLGIPQEDGAIGRWLRRLHRRLYAEGEHVHFYTIRSMTDALERHGFTGTRVAKFGFLAPQYHLHVLLTWLRPTFALGHWVTQHVDATADSLIFSARSGTAVSALEPLSAVRTGRDSAHQ